MKETNKWLSAVFCCSVLCMALNGCGQSGPEAGSPETDSISNAEVLEEEAPRQTGIMPTAAADNQATAVLTSYFTALRRYPFRILTMMVTAIL